MPVASRTTSDAKRVLATSAARRAADTVRCLSRIVRRTARKLSAVRLRSSSLLR